MKRIALYLNLLKRNLWNDISVNIIVSTGRTGTKFLAKFFNENFNSVDSRHEPNPDLFKLGTDFIRSRISFKNTLKEFKKQRQKICDEVHSKNCNYYIESNTYLLYLIPIFKVFFKNYKIVYIIRDGRDYVRSCYNKMVISEINGTTLFRSEDDGKDRLKATDFRNDPYYDKWKNMNRFERLCWHWIKKNEIILNSIEKEKNVLTIKYEDVFNKESNYKGIWDIIDFFELKDKIKFDCENINTSMGVKTNETLIYSLPKWESWTNEQKKQFQNIAESLMNKFNY